MICIVIPVCALVVFVAVAWINRRLTARRRLRVLRILKDWTNSRDIPRLYDEEYGLAISYDQVWRTLVECHVIGHLCLGREDEESAEAVISPSGRDWLHRNRYRR